MRQLSFRMLTSCSKSLANVTDKDFFGIAHITNKEIAGSFGNKIKLPQDRLVRKYQPLMKRRNYLENEQIEHNAMFGKVRFDKENDPKSHGQYEPNNDRKMHDTVEIKQRFVPTENASPIEDDNKIIYAKIEESDDSKDASFDESYRIIDVEQTSTFTEVLKLFKNPDPTQDINKYSNQPPLMFYFDVPISRGESQINEEAVKEADQFGKSETQLHGHKLDNYELESSIIEASTAIDSKPPLVYEPEKDQIPIQELDPFTDGYQERCSEEIKEFDFDKSLDNKYDNDELKPSLRALDYLKKVRAQRLEPTAKGLKHKIQNENPYSLKPSVKLDSKGFRNYTDQVPNWLNCRHIDILNYIESSIIYHNYEILAVNKPYGIASHDEERNREPFDMNNLMQELTAKLKIEKVYLAHRLDKTTTGVLLFATSQERARQLNKLFKSDQIKKIYWCITTKGVPDPEHAIIDIPIGEYTVAGKVRSCLAPEGMEKHKQLTERYKEARRAITEYKVLNSQRHASLVEVKPRTGVKHQIRCHLSFGLNKPILGDHKYSHLEKVAPQVLPMPLLNALHLRQAKVRTLPMHLHAKSIVIPGAKANGETLFINAPLPPHFVENLKALKLMDEYIESQK